MRVGIFGGSFDPVHLGHLWIAQTALETLGLDRVRWIPAAVSPLKQRGPTAPAATRLEMLRLAIAGTEGHVVDDRELRRGELSYTVDTLSELSREHPDEQRFLLIGSDSLATIQQWHEPAQLCELATLAVVQRGGEAAIDFSVLTGIATQARIEAARQHVIPMPIIEVASSDLRRRVANGQSIRFRTPRAVEALITSTGLYRDSPTA